MIFCFDFAKMTFSFSNAVVCVSVFFYFVPTEIQIDTFLYGVLKFQ